MKNIVFVDYREILEITGLANNNVDNQWAQQAINRVKCNQGSVDKCFMIIKTISSRENAEYTDFRKLSIC